MKVLLAASEVHPFAKTGGLADVAGALPRALHALGIEVAVCLPLYPKVRRRSDVREVVAEHVSCPFAGESRPFKLLRTTMPGSPEVPVYLIENPWMFEAEEQLYGTEPGSYGDGHLRFLYFCRALLKIPHATGFFPDVWHLNDWQTALVAPLLRAVHRNDAEVAAAATVTTIHNLAYQGVFPSKDLAHAGVPSWFLQEGKLLEDGLGNLLAGAVRFSDAVTTVSRTYAREILTEEYGNGLEGLLSWRKDLLVGIVNGLDTETWDPSTDPNLPAHYDAGDLAGKRDCRDALLEESDLQPTDGPVFGCVSRLVDQKGLDVVLPVMDALLGRDPSVRLVVLGSGQPDLEDAFRDLESRHPGRVHARLTFDAPFSSLVEAGSDFFLMPSRFEPCGLNQLISMRYGTPPIVRRVGGLRDTVTDGVTGFTFEELNPGALAEAVDRACSLYRDAAGLDRMREAGMETDWSWARSAREYVQVYRDAIDRRADGGHLDAVMQDLPPEPIEVELPELADVPSGYPRDVLTLVPFSPDTLFCFWELGGEASAARIAALEPDARPRIRYRLTLTETRTGEAIHAEIDGTTQQWFAKVAPGGRYRGELHIEAPGQPPQRALDAPEVRLPADVYPEV
ncbi:MAG: glycogen synthase [Planctomycetes bacterium]|nr:glycogen synthase [Planctomycetota bacterium]